MKINYPPLNDREFVIKYLHLCNILLPQDKQLVPSEIALVAEFTILPEDKFGYQRLGTLAKKKVLEATTEQGWNLTGSNINNKLYAILDKGFIRRDEDKVMYLPKHLLHALKKFKEEKKFEVDLLFISDEEQNKSNTI